jgi:hypothetical protein
MAADECEYNNSPRWEILVSRRDIALDRQVESDRLELVVE